MATDQSESGHTESIKTTTPETVTIVAGRLHRWTFTPWPGCWELYDPKPGDLLLVFGEPPNKKAD